MLVLRREVGPLEILPGTAEHLAEVRQMDTDTARMEAIVDEAELRYDDANRRGRGRTGEASGSAHRVRRRINN